jgi:hypothetical protein
MITEQEFAEVLHAVSRTLPRFKPWDASAMALAWMTFPEKAKQELTREIWLYAAGQRRLDPDPCPDKPLDLQLLDYVYRNRDGAACVDWGLKADLPDRMSRPNVFNPQPQPGAVVLPPEEPVTNPVLQGIKW